MSEPTAPTVNAEDREAAVKCFARIPYKGDPSLKREAIEGVALALAKHREDAQKAGREQADEALSLLASTTDLLNTWAREMSVPEAESIKDIRGVADRLWSSLSARLHDAAALRTGTAAQPAPPQEFEPLLEDLTHTRSCPDLTPLNDEGGCTCGLLWRIRLRTEMEMHNAWRKRAEECEAAAAPVVASEREPLDAYSEWIKIPFGDDEGPKRQRKGEK